MILLLEHRTYSITWRCPGTFWIGISGKDIYPTIAVNGFEFSYMAKYFPPISFPPSQEVLVLISFIWQAWWQRNLCKHRYYRSEREDSRSMGRGFISTMSDRKLAWMIKRQKTEAEAQVKIAAKLRDFDSVFSGENQKDKKRWVYFLWVILLL